MDPTGSKLSITSSAPMPNPSNPVMVTESPFTFRNIMHDLKEFFALGKEIQSTFESKVATIESLSLSLKSLSERMSDLFDQTYKLQKANLEKASEKKEADLEKKEEDTTQVLQVKTPQEKKVVLLQKKEEVIAVTQCFIDLQTSIIAQIGRGILDEHAIFFSEEFSKASFAAQSLIDGGVKYIEASEEKKESDTCLSVPVCNPASILKGLTLVYTTQDYVGEYAISKKDRTLHLSIDSSVDALFCNSRSVNFGVALRRILMNPVSNSAKYCPTDAYLDAKWDEKTGELVISVWDNGPGIVKKQDRKGKTHEQIKERAYQIFSGYGVQSSEEDKAHGSGLGGGIATALTESMGGSVTIGTRGMGPQEGFSGTSITYRIPVSKVVDPTPAAISDESLTLIQPILAPKDYDSAKDHLDLILSDMRGMIIDDNIINQKKGLRLLQAVFGEISLANLKPLDRDQEDVETNTHARLDKGLLQQFEPPDIKKNSQKTSDRAFDWSSPSDAASLSPASSSTTGQDEISSLSRCSTSQISHFEAKSPRRGRRLSEGSVKTLLVHSEIPQIRHKKRRASLDAVKSPRAISSAGNYIKSSDGSILIDDWDKIKTMIDKAKAEKAPLSFIVDTKIIGSGNGHEIVREIKKYCESIRFTRVFFFSYTGDADMDSGDIALYNGGHFSKNLEPKNIIYGFHTMLKTIPKKRNLPLLHTSPSDKTSGFAVPISDSSPPYFNLKRGLYSSSKRNQRLALPSPSAASALPTVADFGAFIPDDQLKIED